MGPFDQVHKIGGGEKNKKCCHGINKDEKISFGK